MLKSLDANKSRVQFCGSFRQLYGVWGREHFMMYLRDISYVLPIIQKDGMEAAMPVLLLKVLQEMKSVNETTRKKNAKEALKLFPDSKKMLKEWKKNLDEVL